MGSFMTLFLARDDDDDDDDDDVGSAGAEGSACKVLLLE